MIDEENNMYLFSQYIIYSFNIREDNHLTQLIQTPEMIVDGYIKETEFVKENKIKNCECDVSKNEIIL